MTVALLELGQQVGREDVGQAERRAGVLPGVLVDLAEHERTAVGALVVEDPRPVDVAGVVEHQRAALAADEVLGLVEAQRATAGRSCPAAGPASVPNRPCALSSMRHDVGPVGEHARGCPRRRRHAGVVHDDDRAHAVVEQRRRGARGRGRGSRGSMSQKTSPRALAGEREGGGGERERRDDDGVAGLEVEQHRGQLEGSGARRRQQHLGRAGVLGEERRRALGELARRRRCARPRIGSWTYSSS